MILKFSQTSHRAICSIDGKALDIKRVGHWKWNIAICTDNMQQNVLIAVVDKCYGNTFNIKVENKEYQLIIRNNPLVDYAIMENGKDLLTYGLATENGVLTLRLSTGEKSNYYFDFLLWYLFLPTATENFRHHY